MAAGCESVSACFVKYKPMKIAKTYRDLSNLLQYTSIDTTQVMHTDDTSLQRQQTKMIDHLWNGNDFGAIINTAFDNLVATDPFAGQHPGTTGAGPNQTGMKVFLQSCVSDIEIINQAEHAGWFTLYVLAAKTTGTYEDPTTTWTNAITSDKGLVLGTTPSISFPGIEPTMHKQFNLTWKVVKKIVIHMLPGSTHRHKSFFKINRLIDYDYFTKYTMVKGITFAHMCTARGSVGDNTIGVKGTQIVNYAPVKFDCVFKHHYKSRILSTFPTNHFYSNNMSTITYDEDVTTDHLYVNNPTTGTITDTHDTANIA